MALGNTSLMLLSINYVNYFMFLLTAYYAIIYMCLLFTLWRMNKYQSISKSNFYKSHNQLIYIECNSNI